MASKVKVKKYTGVYYHPSATRKHKGRADRCFYFTYSEYMADKKKLVWKKVGWASEGYSAQFASEERALYIQRMRHGELSPDGRRSEMTFGEAFDLFYESHAKVNKKTHADDLSCYRTHLEARFGHRKLSSITKHDLEQIKIGLLPPADPKERERIIKANDGKEPWHKEASVRRILMLVSVVFNKMIKWPEKSGYKGTNPVARVDMPRPSRKRERFLTHVQAETLLLALKKASLQTYRVAMLSLETGMRMGEIFNMRWRDVDLDNDVVNIPDAKGGTDQKAYLTERARKELRRMRSGSQQELVFVNARGGKVKELSNTFQRVVDKLGLNDGATDTVERVTPHTLRHTYASWLAQSGKVDIYSLQSLMRHKSFSTTQRYIHLIPSHSGHIAARIISELFPDKRIETIGDIVRLESGEMAAAMDELDEFYGREYADDPED